jgi:sialate O-acetylesterase
MVLQREMPVPIWGTAKPGEKITVTFAPSATSTSSPQAGSLLRADATANAAGQAGQTKTATVAEDRKWMVKLDPLKASAEGGVLSVHVSGFSVQEDAGTRTPDTRHSLHL